MEGKTDFSRPDFDRIGLFKEMSYLEGPAQIPPISDIMSRAPPKGKQMSTSSTKSKNGTQSGYFDKEFLRVFEGEGYADPIRNRRLQRLEKAKLNIGPAFKSTSPTKTQNGKGTNYGTFQGKTLEYFSSHPREVEKGSPPKKNFYTNPPKKGTGYGYPNVTIGKVPPYFLEGEYEELKEKPEEPEKPEPQEFEPYKVGIFQQGYFDPNPFRTDEEVELPEEEETETFEIEKPFLPTGPAKKDGGMKAGCLNKFPEYVGDPYAKMGERSLRGVKNYVNAENKMFRYVPGPKPYPIKSIITKNVERRVTPANFTTIKGVVYCQNKTSHSIKN
ncbi:cilia-and flagella-associated protein 96-like [Parasteatoda tepidariorum]|uniref:cilia-and flagella-associated protein 96-like n=1 Tax=Parasteatoda tepidariorum TaxID=114398 RepID=UPI001C71EA03|nr:UPF0602 protein C4orf47 homolog [Parasteatoda tepidariorum]